ncbi:hypothetical protein QTG56_25595 (plasmid) [Rossellomorea sp. AcN35-11]|nr:hypothetical protein [Rossellomorea aquimaris]WJV31990.1 hypothetical protein QTG56_25595 [Rossellomorea sp. AcN35-11]
MSLDICVIKEGIEVVSKDITHNLKAMWKEAGVYDALYDSDGKMPSEVLPALEKGLSEMADDPERFKKFDSPNGWGKYKHALPWLQDLIVEMKKHPDGEIELSK